MKLRIDDRRRIDSVCNPILASASATEEIDVDECRALLATAYDLRGLALPKILVTRSPSEAMTHLRTLSPEATSTPRPAPDVKATLGDGASLGAVWNVIAAAQSQIWPALGAEVDLSFHAEVYSALDTIPWGSEEWPPVKRRVESKVFDLCHLAHTVSDTLEAQVSLESEAWLLYTQAAASLWAEAMEYASLGAALALGHIASPPREFDVGRRLLASCGWLYSFERLCIVCERPQETALAKRGGRYTHF